MNNALPSNAQTIAVHEGEKIATHEAQCEALVLTNSYHFDSPLDAEMKFSGARSGHVYTRISNPTVSALERRIAAMEGTETAVAFSTGMAALDAVFSARLRPGDHIICSRDVFGTTAHLLKTYYVPAGVHVDFADVRAPEEWLAKMRVNTKILFLETPSNPNLYIGNLEKISLLCSNVDCFLVVDNTIATPIIQRPFLHGAHVVIHSAGKYIDGQGRVMGGLVACGPDFANILRGALRNRGSSLSPFNAWILLKSLETLYIRMCAHSEKAAFIVNGLNAHPLIGSVNYPHGKNYLFTELSVKQHTYGLGHGGLLSLTLPGDRKFAWRVMENLKIIAISTNIGDTKSLVTHPASTTHGRLSSDERELASISDNLLRISVGLEDEKELLNDLVHAIDMNASELGSPGSGTPISPDNAGSTANALELSGEHSLR
jgi:O-succinylhomoserine sulfhydrylase